MVPAALQAVVGIGEPVGVGIDHGQGLQEALEVAVSFEDGLDFKTALNAFEGLPLPLKGNDLPRLLPAFVHGRDPEARLGFRVGVGLGCGHEHA